MPEQTLIVFTLKPDLRSEAVGWTGEDSNLYVNGRSIGYTPGPKHGYTYHCVLAAQAAGWKLLAPPQYSGDEEGWNWWLTKDSDQ